MRWSVYRPVGRRACVLLGSSALSALLLTATGAAGEPTPKPTAPKPALQKQPDIRSASRRPVQQVTPSSLSPEARKALQATLQEALRQGHGALVAAVYDQVHAKPATRDAVFGLAAVLAPTGSADLAKAADIAVLTSDRTLALAPNGTRGFVDGARAINGYTAAPISNVARAVADFQTPEYNKQWGLDLIKAAVAYDRGYTGSGVAVAVADTGIDTAHSEFAGKIDTARSRNFQLPSAGAPYVLNQLTDLGDHGTHVAGIIGAKKDGTEMHGVAYDSPLVVMRIIGGANPTGISDSSSAALDYLTTLSDVRVYNASYGPDYSKLTGLTSWSLTDQLVTEATAANKALAAGKIIVAAAGNDREQFPTAARNPNGLALDPFIRPEHANTGVYDDNGTKVDFSALLEQKGQIISVVAVGQDKSIASYSNLCGVTASWCVAAPGGTTTTGIYSTVPGGYGDKAGTSMAAPQVSGAIALLIQAYPNYTAQDIVRVLFSTAEDLGAIGVDSTYGYGLIRLDRATDGPTTLAAASTVTIAANTTTYWSQPLTTSGAFEKAGAGQLIIAGKTKATGDVLVSAGQLDVDGTLTMDTGKLLTIATGGQLSGMGEIDGNVTVRGILAPGISPTTFTVTGNLTLASSAATLINIDGKLIVPGGPGTFDKIVVNGNGNTFTANGSLTPTLRGIAGGNNNFTPAIGDSFKFVEAVNGAGVTGKFSSLVEPTDGLAAKTRLDLVYKADSITLAVTPTDLASFKPDGKPLTAEQERIATLLQNIRPGIRSVTDDTDALFAALFSLDSEDQYATALTQLGNPGQPATPGAVMAGFSAFANVIATRQGAMQSGAGDAQAAALPNVAFAFASGPTIETSPAMMAFAGIDPVTRGPAGPQNWAVWGQAFGRWSNVRGTSDLPGSKSTSAGVTIGADRYLSPTLLAGMAMGFTRTATSSSDMNATSDSYAGAAYLSWTPGRLVVDARAALGPTVTATSRPLDLIGGTVGGKSNGLGAVVAGEVGYRMPVGGYTIKPFAGLEWQGFRRNGYSENSIFGLTYPTQTFTKVVSKLGAAASTRFQVDALTFLPEVRLAWARDMNDTTLTTQAALLDSPFVANAAEPGRDALLVDLSMTAWRTQSLRVFGSVSTEFRRNATSQQVAGGVRYSW